MWGGFVFFILGLWIQIIKVNYICAPLVDPIISFILFRAPLWGCPIVISLSVHLLPISPSVRPKTLVRGIFSVSLTLYDSDFTSRGPLGKGRLVNLNQVSRSKVKKNRRIIENKMSRSYIPPPLGLIWLYLRNPFSQKGVQGPFYIKG